VAEAITLDETDAGDVPGALRNAMRRLASGVAIISAQGPDGPMGLAATSITSLSLDPPSMLVCINKSASLHAHLSVGCRLCVNLLSANQRDVAAAFGGAVARELRFTVGTWEPDGHGVFRLDEAQANISCAVDELINYGTHTIVIAKVDGVRIMGEVGPLIYQDGRYL
jgi:flavin reductase (DIM6/NTAB) family NADH-FMN oxidoreductase RutF